MQTTSASLLQRLVAVPNDDDWRRLVDLYTPFIRRWLRDPALNADADDLAQEVLTKVVRKLPDFRAQGAGSFRAWLRTITVNQVREWARKHRLRPTAEGGSDAAARLNALEDPASELSRRWDREHDDHVLKFLLDQIRPEFSPDTWQAFERQAQAGESAAAVAMATGKSIGSVLTAKSRVLARLRQEADGLL